MPDLVWLDRVFAALLTAVSLLSAARLVVGWRLGDRAGLAGDGAHLLMGVGMVAMFLPGVDPLPSLLWMVAFAVAGAWFAAYLLRGAGPAGRGHQAHVLIGSVAMVYMFALPAPGPEPGAVVALPATGAGVLAHDHSGGMNVAAAAALLAGYFLGHALWSARRVVRAGAVHPSGLSAVVFAPRLAECGHVVMGLAMSYMLATMVF